MNSMKKILSVGVVVCLLCPQNMWSGVLLAPPGVQYYGEEIKSEFMSDHEVYSLIEPHVSFFKHPSSEVRIKAALDVVSLCEINNIQDIYSIVALVKKPLIEGLSNAVAKGDDYKKEQEAFADALHYFAGNENLDSDHWQDIIEMLAPVKTMNSYIYSSRTFNILFTRAEILIKRKKQIAYEGKYAMYMLAVETAMRADEKALPAAKLLKVAKKLKGQQRIDKITYALLYALQYGLDDVRLKAAKELMTKGDFNLAIDNGLVQALDDDNNNVRDMVSDVLIKRGSEDTITRLIDIFKADKLKLLKKTFRWNSAVVLYSLAQKLEEKISNDILIQAYTNAIKHGESTTQNPSIEALQNMQELPGELITFINNRLHERDDFPSVQRSMIALLGKHGNLISVHILKEVIRKEKRLARKKETYDYSTAFAAIDALAELDTDEAQDVLFSLARGRIPDKGFVRSKLQFLNTRITGDVDIRAAALRALGKLSLLLENNYIVRDVITIGLKSKNHDLVIAAGDALKGFRFIPDDILKVVKEKVRKNDNAVGGRLLEVIGYNIDPEIEPLVIEKLDYTKTQNAFVRKTAAKIIGRMKIDQKKAVEVLGKALKNDPDVDVKAEAAISLDMQDERDAIPHLCAAIREDPSVKVHIQCILSLEGIMKKHIVVFALHYATLFEQAVTALNEISTKTEISTTVHEEAVRVQGEFFRTLNGADELASKQAALWMTSLSIQTEQPNIDKNIFVLADKSL